MPCSTSRVQYWPTHQSVLSSLEMSISVPTRSELVLDSTLQDWLKLYGSMVAVSVSYPLCSEVLSPVWSVYDSPKLVGELERLVSLAAPLSDSLFPTTKLRASTVLLLPFPSMTSRLAAPTFNLIQEVLSNRM